MKRKLESGQGWLATDLAFIVQQQGLSTIEPLHLCPHGHAELSTDAGVNPHMVTLPTESGIMHSLTYR